MENKVCFLTGGCSGIGRAVAVRLLEQGAMVSLVDLPNPVSKATAALLADKYGASRVLFVPTDVTDSLVSIAAYNFLLFLHHCIHNNTLTNASSAT